MPIVVRWYDDDKTIFLMEYRGDWTWDDYDLAVANGLALISEVNHPFDQIMDFSQSRTVPKGDIMTHIGRSINAKPLHIRLSISVQPPTVFKSLMLVLEQTAGSYPKRLLASTMEEALTIIATYTPA